MVCTITYLHVGNTLSIEPISASTIFLDPPEKLVLEIRSSGGYNRVRWSKVGDPGFSPPITSFAHFGEVYYVERTTLDDLGRYSVQLDPLPGQRRLTEVYFDVILNGKLYT
jgi:hypothetical protein